jgi:hypothetical protein
MHTFQDYYNELTASEREAFDLALNSAGRRYKFSFENPAESFHRFIDQSFSWADTPQGHTFWYNLAQQTRYTAREREKVLKYTESGAIEYIERHEARAVFHSYYNREIDGVSMPVYVASTGLLDYRVIDRDDRIDSLPIIALQKDFALVITNTPQSGGVDTSTYFMGGHSFNMMQESGEIIEIKPENTGSIMGYYLQSDTNQKRYFKNEESANNSGFITINGTLTNFKYLPADIMAISVLSLDQNFSTNGNLNRNTRRSVQVLNTREIEADYLLLSYRVNERLYSGYEIPQAIKTSELNYLLNNGFLRRDFEGHLIAYFDYRLIRVSYSGERLGFAREWLEQQSSITLGEESHEVNLIYYADEIYLNEQIANDNGVFWCEDCDEWYDENDGHSHDDYDDDNSERDSFNPRFGYHSQSHEDKSKGAKFKVGFEIEKECSDGCRHDHYEIHRASKWVKERDGSLDGDIGYELVSSTYNLFSDEFMNQAQALEAQFPKLINGHTSKSCGGHIHFSKADTLGADLLESVCGYLPILYSIYQHRIGKSYCEVREKEQMKESDNKYQAVRVMRSRIEFRIFPAVKNLSTLEWRLGLIRIMAKSPSSDAIATINKLTDTRTELYKHFAKIFSKTIIMQRAQKALEYAKKFDRNYFNIDLRINASKIKAKESKAIREESGAKRRQVVTA